MILQNATLRFSSASVLLVMNRGVPYFIVNDRFYLEGANPPSAFLNVFQIMERMLAKEKALCIDGN